MGADDRLRARHQWISGRVMHCGKTSVVTRLVDRRLQIGVSRELRGRHGKPAAKLSRHVGLIRKPRVVRQIDKRFCRGDISCGAADSRKL